MWLEIGKRRISRRRSFVDSINKNLLAQYGGLIKWRFPIE